MDMAVQRTLQDATVIDPSVPRTIKVVGRDVNVYYGDKHALKHVNVDIPDKGVMAFIGPSGCGKSTFLRCINRMNDTIPMPEATGRVQVEVPDDLPPVHADRGLLQRVLVNVLDNALRHGGSDQLIEVAVHLGTTAARLEVIDHGPGIGQGEEERLFEPFRRLDDSGPEGVGLGLSVARGFIEAMDGKMVADSTPGGGLTMRISLRLMAAVERGPAGQ